MTPCQEACDTNQATLELCVSDMSCGGCAARVEGAARNLPGVTHATVALAEHRVSVRYDPRRLDFDQIVGAIAAAGYRADRLKN